MNWKSCSKWDRDCRLSGVAVIGDRISLIRGHFSSDIGLPLLMRKSGPKAINTKRHTLPSANVSMPRAQEAKSSLYFRGYLSILSELSRSLQVLKLAGDAVEDKL